MGCVCCSETSSETNYLRAAVFGLENSGKTSLIQCLKTSMNLPQQSKYIATHGVVAVNVHFNRPKHINLIFFDCGGCKHQRHIWPHLNNDADVILYVIDSRDLICLNDAKDALFDLLADESLAEKPLLIVFTKSDLKTNVNNSQLEEKLDLSSINDRPVHKVRFSSISLDGLTSMLTWFDYFNHCKQRGKPLKISTSSSSSSSKHRLSISLNLTEISTIPKKKKIK